MSLRVSLFIDYQNAYHHARSLFHSPADDRTCGHFRPWDLGHLICERYRSSRRNEVPLVLSEVRVYRGEPDRRRDARAHEAFQRQRTSWEEAGVLVRTATVQYGEHGRPQAEKEIDVMLAIDFVVGAIDRSYDVGILFSFDRDMMPALRYVRDVVSNGCRADVGGWGGIRSGRYLSPPGPPPVRHLLGKTDYEHIADSTDYTRPTSKLRRQNRRKRRR